VYLDQVRGDLGVRFGSKFVTLGDETVLKRQIVFYDAVVDNS